MDNRLTSGQQNALIEDVLKSQPLAPMPQDLTACVMASIQVDWLVPALLFGVAALFAGFSIPLLLKMTADDGR